MPGTVPGSAKRRVFNRGHDFKSAAACTHVVKNALGREFAENEHLQDLEYVHRAYRSVLPVTVVASDPRRLESVAQRPQQQVDQPAQQLGLHQQPARGKKVPRGYRRGGACPDPRSVSC